MAARILPQRLARLPLLPALALTLALTLAPRPLPAQDLAGTWRVTRDHVSVTVAEWGTACGPRPTSHDGAVGREVTITTDGSNLTLTGGRTYRTQRCWSENPNVRVVSASRPSPTRWVVQCATAPNAPLGESGEYTLHASDANHLHFRDDTRYTWVIQGSNCNATATLVRDYERINAAPTPTPTPTPTPDAATPRPTPPPRCATPGPAVSLTISPSRRSTVAGARTCFRVRAHDANRCEVPAPATTWSLRRLSGTAEASLDQSCFVAPAGASVGEFEVTATAGALLDRAIAAIVTQDRYRSLVAAQLEDSDGGTSLPPTAPTRASPQIGGVTHTPRASAARHAPSPFVWLLFAAALILGACGVALLASHRRAARAVASTATDAEADPAARPNPSGRPRREAIPIPVREILSNSRPPPSAEPEHVSAPPPVTPPSAPAVPRVLTQRCPVCDQRQPADLAFCPHDGNPLVPLAAGAPAAAPPAVMACPACGTVVRDGSQFCPHDGTPLLPRDPATPVAPSDGVCPKCHRRFPAPLAYCSEDGTALLRTA